MVSIEIESRPTAVEPVYPWKQITLLFILYVIQAIPMGLSAVMPLVLQNRGASYTEIAFYGFASLPFSLKLLWAPIVDSTHLPGLGRRKSWLIPTQLVCAAVLFILGSTGKLSQWTGETGAGTNIQYLTFAFFTMYILMATQDIAVDGWAIEILPQPYKKHASTCNAIGQTVGAYCSSLTFLVLNDADACNRWFRKEPLPYGVASISTFAILCGWIFAFVTAYVAVFVKEDSMPDEELSPEPNEEGKMPAGMSDYETDYVSPSTSISTSYWLLWRMIKMRPVQFVALFLLTARIPFGPIDGAIHLKMLEAGVKKDQIALLSPVVIPWGVVGSYTAGKVINKRWTALEAYRGGYIVRLGMALVLTGVFLFTREIYKPLILDSDSRGSKAAFWTLVYVCTCIQTFVSEYMFACLIAFFAQVSDPAIGGTAMTFFNTLANLGGKYPSMVALALMGKLQWLPFDSFIVLVLVCFSFGLVWLTFVGLPIFRRLDTFPADMWRLRTHKSSPRESVIDTTSSAPSRIDTVASLNKRATPQRSPGQPDSEE